MRKFQQRIYKWTLFFVANFTQKVNLLSVRVGGRPLGPRPSAASRLSPAGGFGPPSSPRPPDHGRQPCGRLCPQAPLGTSALESTRPTLLGTAAPLMGSAALGSCVGLKSPLSRLGSLALSRAVPGPTFGERGEVAGSLSQMRARFSAPTVHGWARGCSCCPPRPWSPAACAGPGTPASAKG